MKERPIIFNNEMVRAILDGRKTMTRRVCKLKDLKRNPDNDPWYKDHIWSFRVKSSLWTDHTMDRLLSKCPYGQVGYRLWVRETYTMAGGPDGSFDAAPIDGRPHHPSFEPVTHRCFYRATEPGIDVEEYGWTPSIYMPRWASRITLEITEIRVERLQDISEVDARAEGIIDGGCLICGESEPCGCDNPQPDARDAFVRLWQSINGKYPGKTWDDNPYCWVISFRRVEK